MMFSSPDTLIPDAYNPLDWNRYPYVHFNPINATDPTGHSSCYAGGSIKAGASMECYQTQAKIDQIQIKYKVKVNNDNDYWNLSNLGSIDKGMSALMDDMGEKRFQETF